MADDGIKFNLNLAIKVRGDKFPAVVVFQEGDDAVHGIGNLDRQKGMGK